MTDEQIIQAYKIAFKKFSKDGVIDLDKRITRQWSYQIHRLEQLLPELKSTFPPFRQSDFLINYMTSGSGNRTIGYYHFMLQDKTLSITPRRVIQSAYVSPESKGYVLVFNLDFFLQQGFPYRQLNKKKVLKRSVRPYLVLNRQQDQAVVEIFENILIEHENRPAIHEEMIALKILELLILCDRFFVLDEQRSGNLIFDRTMDACSLLHEKNLQQRSVQWFANMLHTHPNHLNYIAKKITGFTAKQIIDDRIVLEAQYLLANTSLSVKEIAYELGFKNSDYFITYFKRHTKQSPNNFRVKQV